ncbi:FAD-linked oxidase C-terminal domain-containing protein [Neisseria shayeganii]|uniref:Glycolate oxidase, subunit GlcD n=1 Tax=Neisseria shayeganii 871 TaxID=1032488 RepID=G4CHB5_9NEIS|nr:FAD-linked oxidase C-terminal domain-containing protein [Neisseria shayeganii]EGY52773.1 glycolate oxidase, subunit GlcD [Neisseria shayeganii 871]
MRSLHELTAEERASIVRTLADEWQEMEVLVTESEITPYECDAMSALRVRPLIVVLPETEAQVQKVLRTCFRLNIPVVPRGAGTGLAGSALPQENGVLLVMTKFNRILEVNQAARTATVQPGVRNLAISEAAARYKLYYAPDPSSQIACSIGGNVNENSGGVHCLKYGLTVNNVLKVRAITISGEVVEFGSHALDAPGLDLLTVFIGSEGMFAVVTEVVVKLIPTPQLAQVVMASFDDMGKAGNAVADVIAAGIIPAGLEMMDGPCTRAVDSYLNIGYDTHAEAILLCEADGTPEEVAEEIGRMKEVLEKSGAIRLQVSRNEIERLAFWSGRKNAFPAAAQLNADYYCMDGTIPRRHISQMLAYIAALEPKYNLQCINVFHAGDGNMHPLILFNSANEGEWERAEAFGVEILEECVRLGGTITGEHGVGMEKINQMCVQFNNAEREAFWGVKYAFDPSGLLNADKNIPTKNRCAEYGKLHVKNGQMPFPELERF